MGLRRDYGDSVFGGLFPNSNHLCGFLELTAFPLLALALFGRVHSFVRVLCGMVFAAAGVTAAFSTSRGGMAAFAAGMAVCAGMAGVLQVLRRRGHSGGGRTAGLLFTLLVALVAGIGILTWRQLEHKFGEGRVFNSLNGRPELWERAYEQWQESPFTGTGARSFEYYETSYRNIATPWITWSETDVNARFAHSDWIQVLSDYGLAGLLLALAVFGLHAWKAFAFVLREAAGPGERRGFFPDHRGALSLGALCGMVAFAIHCAADFQMHVGINAVLAAAVLGLMASPGAPADSTVRPPFRRSLTRPLLSVAATVPAVLLGLHFVPWARSDYWHLKGEVVLSGPLTGDHLTAISIMERAAAEDPLNYKAFVGWGTAEFGASNLFKNVPAVQAQFLEKALTRFKEAHRLYPQNADISATVGRTLDALSRFEEAEHWFLLALQWGDGSRLIHHYYADHLMPLGRYAEAIKHYNTAMDKHKYGGWKRQLLQRKMTRAQQLLQRQQEQKPAPPPASAQPPQ
jgi:O-antigen ligase